MTWYSCNILPFSVSKTIKDPVYNYIPAFLPSSVWELKLPLFPITPIIKLSLAFGTNWVFAFVPPCSNLARWLEFRGHGIPPGMGSVSQGWEDICSTQSSPDVILFVCVQNKLAAWGVSGLAREPPIPRAGIILLLLMLLSSHTFPFAETSWTPPILNSLFSTGTVLYPLSLSPFGSGTVITFREWKTSKPRWV